VTAPATYADYSEPVGMMPLAIPEEPGEPFGVIALPDSTVPVTDQGIQRAYAALLAHYKVPADVAERDKDARPIGKQIDYALAIAQDRARWTLHEHYVAITGSKGDHYRVTPGFCEGSTWLNAGRRTKACKGSIRAAVGMCSHQLTIELLRLAQYLDHPIAALTVVDDPTPEPASEPAPAAPSEILAVELPGWAVFALCGPITVKQKKAEAEDVEILISPYDGAVSFASGTYNCTVPATPSANAIVVLGANAFQQLWDAVRVSAMDAESIAFTLVVNEDASGTLTLAGGRVQATVPSMTMLQP
jgi:hypothetical protein